jgi:hypothetical protein
MKKGDLAWKVRNRETKKSCIIGESIPEFSLCYRNNTTVKKIPGTIGIMVFDSAEAAAHFINNICDNKFDDEIVCVKVGGRITKLVSVISRTDDLKSTFIQREGYTYSRILQFLTFSFDKLKVEIAGEMVAMPEYLDIERQDAPPGTYAVGQVEVLG